MSQFQAIERLCELSEVVFDLLLFSDADGLIQKQGKGIDEYIIESHGEQIFRSETAIAGRSGD